MVAAVFAQSVPAVVQTASGGHWLHLTFPRQRDSFSGLARDPSGRFVWLSDVTHGALLRVATDKTATRFTLTSSAGPFTPGFVTFASDGAIYAGGCLASGCDVIGRLSPDRRTFDVIATPSGDGPGIGNQLATAPDGTIWFVSSAYVGSIDRRGAIREYPSGMSKSGPNIIAGQNGWIWYDGMHLGSSIDRVDAGYLDPVSRKVDVKDLGAPYFFSGPVEGMALDGRGKVAVLVTDEAATFTNWDIVELDPNLNETLVWLDVSRGNGSAALIAGNDHDLWWGTTTCPASSSFSPQPCTLGRYDPASGALSGFEWPAAGSGYNGASDLALGDDGSVWGLCCTSGGFGTSDSVLIYRRR
jgi:streptogramin lyase